MIQLNKPAKIPQKIVLLITRLDRGGSAELTMQLAAGLSQRGFDIILISGRTIEPLWNTEQYAVNHGFSIQFINSLVRPLNPVKDFVALIRIVKILNDIQPDILHTNSSKAGLLGRFAGVICRINKVYHSPHGHIFYGYYNRFISHVFILLEKIAAHFTTKILNLTEFGRQDHIHENIAKPDKFTVSSCGVELEPFLENPARNLFEPLDYSIQIVWAGRIVPIKNLELLLKSAELLQLQKLLISYKIVGDGELMFASKSFVQQKGLRNIEFLGYRTDLPEILAKCDLFILTSLNEGFGRVLVEAMASGLAIIATKVGGVPEIITDGINGLLIPSDDPDALCNAIMTLYKKPEMRRQMGFENSKKAEFYSLNNYVDKIINIYQIFN